ncbi:uncharacterized protein [Zea mays]|uniref:uncharacterized protein n=1 Tax=Zea mays TaxID=4577 RepID=UPI0009A9CA56|nr:uncharacterized protein LOC118476952 [Zea mays]|eukprot:XP_020407252.1 uncharacterized protein LOC100382748 isoform X1 [Zea mays]
MVPSSLALAPCREQFPLADAPAMAPFFPAQRLGSPSPKLQRSWNSSASLFIFLPADFPPLLLLAPSSFSLVRQQGAPARSAAVASKSLRSGADPKQQPRWLRALPACCFVLRSEQHAIDARQVFAVFAQPHP